MSVKLIVASGTLIVVTAVLAGMTVWANKPKGIRIEF